MKAAARFRFLIPALLALLAAAPTAKFGFVADDFLLIVEDPAVHSLKHTPQYFLTSFSKNPQAPEEQGSAFRYYRPLTKLSFALDWAFGKSNPAGYHVTNALLHAAAATLVYLMASGLGIRPFPAVMAGAFLAVWPVGAMAVSMVSARMNILTTVGALLVCAAPGLSLPLFWVLLGTFVSVFSKENGVFVPFLLVTVLWVRGWSVKDVLRYGGASAAVVLVYLIMRWSVPGTSLNAGLDLGSAEWIAFTGKSIGVHLLMLTGWDPSSVRLLLPPKGPWDPAVLVSWIAYGTLCAWCATGLLRRNRAAWCAVWILTGVSVVILGKYIDTQYPRTIVTFLEARNYSPEVGLALLAGLALDRAPPIRSVRWACALLIPVLAAAFWVRSAVYATDQTMAGEYLKRLRAVPMQELPGVLQAERFMFEGMDLIRSGKFPAATATLERAAASFPGNPAVLGTLCSAYVQSGEYRKAAPVCETALGGHTLMIGAGGREQPYRVSLFRGTPELHALLARAHAGMGRLDEAEKHLESAAEWDDANPDYPFGLALISAQRGDWKRALDRLVRSLELRPCYYPAIDSMAHLELEFKAPEIGARFRELTKNCPEPELNQR